MVLQSKVVLFGDLTADPCPLLKTLYRSSIDSPTLKAFFDRTSDGLRQELALAEPSDRSTFPTFNTISGLVEAYSQNDDSDVAVATVLLCVYQLALLLMYNYLAHYLVLADCLCFIQSRKEP